MHYVDDSVVIRVITPVALGVVNDDESSLCNPFHRRSSAVAARTAVDDYDIETIAAADMRINCRDP